MIADRVHEQYQLAKRKGKYCLVESNVNRLPADSTPHYTNWLNKLSDEDYIYNSIVNAQ